MHTKVSLGAGRLMVESGGLGKRRSIVIVWSRVESVVGRAGMAVDGVRSRIVWPEVRYLK
jgi:hypothetical protein